MRGYEVRQQFSYGFTDYVYTYLLRLGDPAGWENRSVLWDAVKAGPDFFLQGGAY